MRGAFSFPAPTGRKDPVSARKGAAALAGSLAIKVQLTKEYFI